jgi:hypothetical protein
VLRVNSAAPGAFVQISDSVSALLRRHNSA